MIAIPAGARVLLATKPVDFRKGAHGLAALAAEVLREDPFSGAVLVFRSKRADPAPFCIPISIGLGHLPLAPAPWQAAASLRALGTKR